MKAKYLVIVFIMANILNFGQDYKAGLFVPDIQFPDSIIGNRFGNLLLEFVVDSTGSIKSFYISAINLFDPKINKIKNVDLPPWEAIFNYRFPQYNTKAGLALVKKLKPWVNKFGSATKYYKSPDKDRLSGGKWGGGIAGHRIDIGSKALKKKIELEYKKLEKKKKE